MAERKAKRYHLVIPDELYEQVKQIADERGVSVVDVFRQFIKLGVLVDRVANTPGAEILIRDGERERQLVLLL